MARVTVIGAGPTGIAAALEATARGHETTVLEAREVGASLLQWGATRFFTPLNMNVTPRMLELSGTRVPPDAILTGPEYVDQILRPIAARIGVRTQTSVVSVSRRGLTRTDYAGHPLRAEKPFRILTDHDDLIEADVVLDAGGSTAIPLPFAARGQTNVKAIRTLGELDERKGELRGKRVLLVGHGHSAANAITVLRDMGADVTWVVRTPKQRPCDEIANDPLLERRRVVEMANDAAADVRVERRASVESVARNNGHIDVLLSGNRHAQVDAIVAMTGFRPAAEYTAELALEISHVNEGGARLYRAISSITDCLCTPSVSTNDLESGEPNYYFVGARAYGRSRTFLLQTGFRQLETIIESIS
jgi:thioredoxin reductase